MAQLFDSSSLVIDKTDVLVGVEGFGEHSVNLIARAWITADNVLVAHLELLEQIKAIFDESKITVPYTVSTSPVLLSTRWRLRGVSLKPHAHPKISLRRSRIN